MLNAKITHTVPEEANHSSASGGYICYPFLLTFKFQEVSIMSKKLLDRIVSGVLFDFMGWLTCRDERLILSAKDDAGPAAAVISEFLKMRGVDPNCAPLIKDWQQLYLGDASSQSCPEDVSIFSMIMDILSKIDAMQRDIEKLREGTINI
jgi:hypothetical protein